MGPGKMAKADVKATVTLMLTALSLGSTARRFIKKLGSLEISLRLSKVVKNSLSLHFVYLAEAPIRDPMTMSAMNPLKGPSQFVGQ